MVTGAYAPELSGASLQCRALVNALAGHVSFAILTTTTNTDLATSEVIDGIPVHRVALDPARLISKAAAAGLMTGGFLKTATGRRIVHFHGFSQKTIALAALARLLGKRILLKQTSVGHDDDLSLAAAGGVTRWTAGRVDCFSAPSPAFAERHARGPFSTIPMRIIPNGVDIRRFAPPDENARRAAKKTIGVDPSMTVVLHVGFFSRDKAPDVAFDAWADLAAAHPHTVLVFVGATQSTYYEVDSSLADRIRSASRRGGLDARVRFVERADDIAVYYRAADIFVLASMREGMPNVLLEAMASGVACVASRLPGVTDTIIQDGTSGVLFPPGDRATLSRALRDLLENPDRAAAFGGAARRAAVAKYATEHVARDYLDLYRVLNRG